MTLLTCLAPLATGVLSALAGTHKIHIMLGPNVRMLDADSKDVTGPTMLTLTVPDGKWEPIPFEPHFLGQPLQASGQELKYACFISLHDSQKFLQDDPVFVIQGAYPLMPQGTQANGPVYMYCKPRE